MTSALLSRFTPSLMSADTLEGIFVQRQDLAARLVELTRESALTPSKHYTLLIGPRGIGKTHLIALLYHRIAAMADLRDGLRIAWLREEEWGVTSFLDLLLRIFTALDREYQDEVLARQVESLYALSPDDAEHKAVILLNEYVGDRTLLLLMENLDELFDELGEDGQRNLRSYLQENPLCTIVATAQSLFNGISRRTSPFYGFFRIRHLEVLSLDDAVLLLTQIARHEKNRDLIAFLRKPEGRARVRAIEHLGGGNHRVYVILAQFLTRESLDELVSPFLNMLDDLTPYYQARMAWLSPQQRKLVNFLCDHSSAVTVKEIAQRCFVTPQTASSQLKKLQDMGYVRSTVVGRESFYELREPLMRIGTEVKKHRGGPIHLFVEFLRHWYAQEELVERLQRLQPDATLDREYLHAALRAAQAEFNQKQSRAFDAIPPQGRELDKAGTQEKVSDASDGAIEKSSDFTTAWSHQAWVFYEEGRYEDAIAVYDDVVSRFAQSSELALQEQVARALVNKAIALGELGRSEDEIAVYDDVVSRFAQSSELVLQERVARALVNKGYRLGALGRREDAIAVCDDVVLRFAQSSEPALQEGVARALVNKGIALGALGRSEDAIAVCDDVVSRFAQSSEPALQEQVARVLVNKGEALTTLGQYHEAINAYDGALTLDPKSAATWYYRDMALFALNRWNDALVALDDALTRFPKGHEQLAITPADESLRLLFTKTDPEMWQAYVKALIALYEKHDALAALGQGLVRGISALYSPMVSNLAAQRWYDTWYEFGGKYDDLQIPLRLLDAAVRYRDTQDQRVLLGLPIEERKIMEQILSAARQS